MCKCKFPKIFYKEDEIRKEQLAKSKMLYYTSPILNELKLHSKYVLN